MENSNSSTFDSDALPKPWNTLVPIFVRIFVWLLIFSILYILRSFSLLIFLTFVFAYIQAHAVDKLKRFIQNRPLRVVLVGLIVLALIIGVVSFLFPRFKEQAELFASRYNEYLHAVDRELLQLSATYPAVGRLFAGSLEHTPDQSDPGSSISGKMLEQLLGVGSNEAGPDTRELIHGVRRVTTSVLATTSAFLLSLLFSFLIVLDLPALTRSVRGLSDSKLAFIYHEVADNIKNFARVLGSALEAQLFIALINTALTALGIYFLGLGSKVAFLSLIVFICSFIPVAGVFISSIPICLLTLQQGGIALTFFAVLLIWIIHMIEAYVLNPRIYGHHLRINPVLVLIILTVGGKLAGFWGLILGLPVCTYIFQHAIRHRKPGASGAPVPH